MRNIYTILTAMCLAACSASPVSQPASSSTPYGEPMPIREGTLANAKLVHDATVGVMAKVAALGCSTPDNFQPWVMQEPTGQPGSRVWHEKWVVTGCGNTYPVKIRFNESGMNAADWTIQ